MSVDGTKKSQPEGSSAMGPLYQLPPQFCEACEHAVREGLAASAQEYWRRAFYGDVYPLEGMSILEMVVTGIVRSNSPAKADKRSPDQRVNDVLRALIGSSYHDYGEDRDDRGLLWKMASMYDSDVHSDKDVRSLARSALTELRGEHEATESSVRRLTGKFREHRTLLLDVKSAADERRERLERLVVAEIVMLLRSVGVATDMSGVATPLS